MIKNWIGLKTFIGREINRFMRVWIQTLMSPWINATLYILIFGYIVGSRIEQIGGVQYIDFVLPGVLMLNLINSAFGQTSSSVYFQRFSRFIEEALIAPLSDLEMIIGYVVGGITRGFIVSFGIFILAIIFSAANLSHLGWFLFYSITVAIIFSLVGILVGMWAENFEQQSLINTFIITPFTFLGGVFNSIEMLPETAQVLVQFNPFFYFVDGLRYSMVGVSEANTTIGLILILSLIVVLTWIVWYLFKIGWRIRE